MALTIDLEHIEDSALNPSRSYFITDDSVPPNPVSQIDAENLFIATAPASIDGALLNDVQRLQLSEFAWRFRGTYAARTLRKLTPLTAGNSRLRFNFVAKPRKLERSSNTVAKFPATAPSHGGMINVRQSGNGAIQQGVTIPVPTANIGRTVVLTANDAATMWNNARLMHETANSLAVGIFQPGELFLVSVRGQQRDDFDFQVDVDWSFKPNVTNETRGDVTGVSYEGHDFVWDFVELKSDRTAGILHLAPAFSYVERVWGRTDLNNLGVLP